MDEWSRRPQQKPVKGKYGEPQHWDGLSSVFVSLAQKDGAQLTPSEKGWLKALKSTAQLPDAE
jgi:hypothetical protein